MVTLWGPMMGIMTVNIWFLKKFKMRKIKIGINSKMYMECEYLLRKGTRDTDLLKQANDNLKSS